MEVWLYHESLEIHSGYVEQKLEIGVQIGFFFFKLGKGSRQTYGFQAVCNMSVALPREVETMCLLSQ